MRVGGCGLIRGTSDINLDVLELEGGGYGVGASLELFARSQK